MNPATFIFPPPPISKTTTSSSNCHPLCISNNLLPTIFNLGNPNKTLYIQNINEKASIPTLKYDLNRKFSAFGKILQIVAKKNLKMRGQAFVTFSSLEESKKALENLQGMLLYGKPMVIRYAKYKSDVVSREDGTWKEEHEKIEQEKASSGIASSKRQQVLQTLKTTTTTPSITPSNALLLDSMNKTLFIQGIPEEIALQPGELDRIFSAFTGFIEVRTIPARPDLAFVDYESELQANAAKISLEASSSPMKIAFAKK